MVKKLLLLLLVCSVLFTPIVYGGALLVDETGSTDIVIGQATEAQLTRTTQGSNVTITNIVTEVQTTHWAAFLGNVTANLALTGGESQGIFEFTLNGSNIDGVAATTDPNFDWGSFQNIVTTDADLLLNISSSAADSVTSSFNTTEFYLGVSDVPTQYLKNLTVVDPNSPTSIAADTASPNVDNGLDDAVFIGGLHDGILTENFMGGTSEYQMLVGINETEAPGLQTEVTFYFWLMETST